MIDIGRIIGTDGPSEYTRYGSTTRRGSGHVSAKHSLVLAQFGSGNCDMGYLSPAQARAFAHMLLSAADTAEKMSE